MSIELSPELRATLGGGPSVEVCLHALRAVAAGVQLGGPIEALMAGTSPGAQPSALDQAAAQLLEDLDEELADR